MDSLHKLAGNLISEADRIAAGVLNNPREHLKEIDVIVQLCDAHAGICKSVELDERFGGKDYRGIIAGDSSEAALYYRNVNDELRAAEKYHQLWLDTGDATYKAIGRDELKHAEQLIKAARAKPMSQEETAQLQELMIWQQALSTKLS